MVSAREPMEVISGRISASYTEGLPPLADSFIEKK